uniref:Uncharacterized protein n=1 Tax=Romanomermis culicivorax TaxID=13658 RepID=A0A915INI3_ROMCU
MCFLNATVLKELRGSVICAEGVPWNSARKFFENVTARFADLPNIIEFDEEMGKLSKAVVDDILSRELSKYGLTIFKIVCQLAEGIVWQNVPVGRTYLLAERTVWSNNDVNSCLAEPMFYRYNIDRIESKVGEARHTFGQMVHSANWFTTNFLTPFGQLVRLAYWEIYKDSYIAIRPNGTFGQTTWQTYFGKHTVLWQCHNIFQLMTDLLI